MRALLCRSTDCRSVPTVFVSIQNATFFARLHRFDCSDISRGLRVYRTQRMARLVSASKIDQVDLLQFLSNISDVNVRLAGTMRCAIQFVCAVQHVYGASLNFPVSVHIHVCWTVLAPLRHAPPKKCELVQPGKDACMLRGSGVFQMHPRL